MLQKITVDTLPSVTGVHLGSFPESALSRLGAATVERYYRWQLDGPHDKVWAVGAFLAGRCVGYSFSGVFNGSTSGFIRRNRRHLIGKVLLKPWLLLDPFFLERLTSGIKLVFARRTSQAQRLGGNVESKPRSYGILSIAVSVEHQKLGIGQILMLDAEREAAKCNFSRMHLTVNPKNAKAIRFYEKLGWIRDQKNSDWRGRMVKNLEQVEAAVVREVGVGASS